MKYTFEKTSQGDFQVRLNGEFITYSDEMNPAIVDERLKENGFNSREEYFNYLIGEHNNWTIWEKGLNKSCLRLSI